MAIRQDIILDPTKGIKGLDLFEKNAIRSAREQKKAWKENQRSIDALQQEIKQLAAARDAANNPRTAKMYQGAIDKIEKQQKSLRKETEKYDDAVKKNAAESESSFKKIGRSAKLWLAGAAAGAILYITSFLNDMRGEMMRFEQELRKSWAIMGDLTEDQKDRMKKNAQEVATELNIATDKVAEGYYFLASAGLDVEQQIANLPQVARFAKAGMFDLATATDLATDAQSALGLTVKDAAENQENLVRVTDVLTKANTVANASIQQFSESLTNKAATRLRQYNKDIEEGTAVLAAYADQGIKGRLAGERLNILYRELARASRENASAFNEAGIAVFDAGGKMRNTADIIADLESAFDGLTDEEVDAKLAQLGFTSEVSDAISPILGLSEKIRGYEGGLRNAAGTTDEVANNQLKSLTERFGLLKRQIIQTFGDDVLNAIEATANALEGLLSLFKDTQREAAIREILPSLKEAGEEGMYFNDYRQLERDIISFYDEQTKLTDKFNQQNRELKETIKSYSTWAKGVGDSSQKVSDATEELKLREFALQKNIEKNKDAVKSDELSIKEKAKLNIKLRNQTDRLKSVQEALKAVSDSQQEVVDGNNGGGGGNTKNILEGAIAQYEKLMDLQRQLDFTDIIAGRGNLQPVLDVVNKVDKSFSDFTMPEFITDRAMRDIQQFNIRLTDLNNKLSSGQISNKQYQEELDRLTQGYLTRIQELYKSIEEYLGPEQKKIFEGLFGELKKGIEDAKDEGDDFKTNLEDIADVADSIINVADAFGAIGDNARKSLSGISDVLRSMQKLSSLGSGAGVLDYAIPGIGIASGILSIASGISGGQKGPSEKEMRELAENIRENRLELARNTRAIQENTVIAGQASRSQIDQLEGLFKNLLSGLTTDLGGGYETQSPLSSDEIIKYLQDIESLGKEGDLGPAFQGIVDQFKDLLKQEGGDVANALERLLNANRDLFGNVDIGEDGLGEALSTVINQFGEAGSGIEAFIQEFNDAIKYGGVSVNDAIDDFVISLQQLDSNIPSDILNEIKSLDISTEEGQNRLKEIIKTLFNNREEFMGDLTPDQYSNLLDFLGDQSDGSVSASSSDGYSRSVQIGKSITEIQANELVFLTEAQLSVLSDIFDALVQGFNSMGGEVTVSRSFNGSMPSFKIPIPLPVEVRNIDELGGANMSNPAGDIVGGQSKVFNFNGPISIEKGMTNDDIDDVTRAFNKRLKKENQGSKF